MEEGSLENETATVNEIEEMFKEDIESGHNMNLEYANFLYSFKNDYKSALELVLKESELRPNNIDVNKSLAFIYYGLKENENAMKYLSIAMATNKQDADLYCLEGLIKNNSGIIEKSLEINPYQNHKFIAEAKR